MITPSATTLLGSPFVQRDDPANRSDNASLNFRLPAARYIMIVDPDFLRSERICDSASVACPGVQCAVFRSACEAYAQLAMRPAWLGVIGLNLPDVDGLDLLESINASRLASRLLVVTQRRDEWTRWSLRHARVNGCFDSRGEDSESLATVMRQVVAGRSYMSSTFSGPLRSDRKPSMDILFTPAQLRVFAVIGAGADDQETAHVLHCSPHTVRTHREQVMRKLGAQTRAELMHAAVERGVVRFVEDGRVLWPGFQSQFAALADRA